MKPERWQQIDQILDGALLREGSQRESFLDEACSGDASLRQEVESLLEAGDRAESFIESPALEEAAKAMAQDQVQSMVGQELGPYRILSLLGTGGMGEVYLAQDTKLDRKVALKFMIQAMQRDETARRRFLREAKSAAALDHPFICKIYETGQAQGKDFISMEYVQGNTLRDELSEGPLALKEALRQAVEIAEALETAHGQEIVHRDLKPSNIMITPDGHVKVLDFGLAKRLDPADETGDRREKTLTANLTQTGDTLGTVPYMSPEQLRWQAADARSDIFSFGVLLYEMITGIHPFRKHSPAETANAILSQDPAPLTRYVEGIPELLQHTVKKMLAKEPGRRYQSVKGLLVDLEQLKRDLDWEKAAVPVSAPARKAKLRRRLVWGVALLSSLLIAGIAVWLLLAPSPTPVVLLEALPLTSSPGLEHYPTFSPDGNQVAYSWNGGPEENFDLYVKLIGGGRPLPLTTDPADDISPAWSPDGRRIAFLRVLPAAKASILLIPALGGPEREIAEIDLNPLPTGIHPNSYLAWYPDGNWLITSHAEEESPTRVGLFLVSIGTGEKRRLTFAAMRTNEADMDPSLSPDGHTLAFTRTFSAGVSDLFLLELSPEPGPKGEPKRLTSRKLQSTSPHWTADGEEILFSSGGFRGNRSLWKIAVAGSGQPQRLAALDPETVRFVASHQGNRLVYVRELFDSNIWRFKVPGPGGRIRRPSRFITSSRRDGLGGGKFSSVPFFL